MLRSDLEEKVSHRELVEWMIYDEYILEMQEKKEGETEEMERPKIVKKKMSVEEAKAEARLNSDNLARKLREAEMKAGIR